MMETDDHHPIWRHRVNAYVEKLQLVVDAMDLTLEQFKPEDVASDPERLDQSSSELARRVEEMELMVADRESLLSAEDTPTTGTTLTQKLRSGESIEDHRLASRLEQISSTLANSHQRAISLFVCQYHLAELSGDIVNILSGGVPPATYARQGNTTAGKVTGEGRVQGTSGGALFNEAG